MFTLIQRLLVVIAAVMAVTACGNSPDLDGPSLPPVAVDPAAPGPDVPRHRYSFNNQCFAIKSVSTDAYLSSAGGGYSASATAIEDAEAFYFKPTALGYYMLFNRSREVLLAGTTVTTAALADVTDDVILEMRAVGDNVVYPEAPEQWLATATSRDEPTPAEVNAYRNFAEPNTLHTQFNLSSESLAQRLVVANDGSLGAAAASNTDSEAFVMEAVTGCAEFPEAHNNTIGDTYSGTFNGKVIGMADTHMHMSATDFLGKSHWGWPTHKFGVTHALEDCSRRHGQNGTGDAIASGFGGDPGHATEGWPTHPAWPSRSSLLHEAIYWKWLERAWKAGLRVMVNDLVENETLCELARNSGLEAEPNMDCNSMNNAGRQAGTMYATQDYIDAQYGGRGEGWFQIVWDPAEARDRIAEGRLAVVLGIEISNLLDCKVNYGTARQQEPFQEDGSGGTENSYACDEQDISDQLDRIIGYGVRQVITIHEFDNAFGGNGIFEGLILNAGSRENSGGIPSGSLANPNLGAPPDPTQPPELPSGEFWITYDCPQTENDPTFEGYLYGGGGTTMPSIEPSCTYQGQGDGSGAFRPGGPTNCYPEPKQCNARWLTPIGLTLYSRMMEKGLIFDIDHLEIEMKTQALELAEAQDPPYPFVSTHGTFGGTTIEQTKRIFRNGGHIYPSLGNGPGHIGKMDQVKAVWDAAWTQAEKDAGMQYQFGFGFGTDTNGLSAQSGPRGNIADGKAVVYPYTLFDGPIFDAMPEFASIAGVIFEQPKEEDETGNGRDWHLDVDGSAHYGMLSGMVQEMRLEGSVENMRDLFNSAEVYLQTWERTLESQQGIIDAGGTVALPVNPILRRAPMPSSAGRRIP